MAEILSGFALMPRLVMMYLGACLGNPKGALFQVQSDVEAPKVSEGFF
jgi:hypothetical protein